MWGFVGLIKMLLAYKKTPETDRPNLFWCLYKSQGAHNIYLCHRYNHSIIWKTVVWSWVFSPWSWSDANPLFIGLCFWFGSLLTIFHIIFTYILKIHFEYENIREIFHGLMSPNYHIKMSAKMISFASSSTFSKFPTRTKTSSWDIRDVIATIYATKLQGSKRHFTQELENSWPMIYKLCDWSWS